VVVQAAIPEIVIEIGSLARQAEIEAARYPTGKCTYFVGPIKSKSKVRNTYGPTSSFEPMLTRQYCGSATMML
jgi:hypothetical protein